MFKTLFQKISPEISYFFLFVLLISSFGVLVLVFSGTGQIRAESNPAITSLSVDVSDPDICKMEGGITVCKSGKEITFKAEGSSSDNSDLYLFVCKRILVISRTCLDCEPGNTTNCWAVSTEAEKSATNPVAVYDSSLSPESPCEYMPARTIYAKVCDGLSAGALCSPIEGLED